MSNPSGAGGFLRGKSGNPGGRPRSLANVMHEARRHTQPALATLVKLMKGARSEAVRLGAAEAILSRAWGKPVQSLQLDGHFISKKLTELAPEELTVLEERLSLMNDQGDMLELIENKGTDEQIT
jgi:hypothetical protein